MDASRLRKNAQTVVHTWLLTYNTSEVQLKGERASLKINFSVRNTAMFSEEKFQLYLEVFIPLRRLSRETLAHHP